MGVWPRHIHVFTSHYVDVTGRSGASVLFAEISKTLFFLSPTK